MYENFGYMKTFIFLYWGLMETFLWTGTSPETGILELLIYVISKGFFTSYGLCIEQDSL